MKTKEVTYVYDVFDRRIAKDVDDDGNGTIDRGEVYVYDSAGKRDPGTGVQLDNIVLVYDRSDALVARYLHGPAIDEALTEENASGDVLWSLADHLGTVRDWATYDAGTDVTTVDNHLTFTAFGTIASQTNGSHTVRFAFTGREWDVDADLFYYRARWYDPLAGRFLSEDPLSFAAGDANVSRYVGNSPTEFNDPAGLAGESRTLTYSERQALHSIFLAALPALNANETRRVQLTRVLSQVRLWDANTIRGWHTLHAWNIISQFNIYYLDAQAVILGAHQYYVHFPAANDPRSLPLIGHETFHSLHAEMMTSTTAFLIGYGTDLVVAGVYGDDPYFDNLSEMAGRAMENTIQQMLKGPAFMALYRSGQLGDLPESVKQTIRIRFNANMSKWMQK